VHDSVFEVVGYQQRVFLPFPSPAVTVTDSSSKGQDRFLKKKCGNQTVGAPGLANEGRGAVGTRIEAPPPPQWGGEPLPRKKSILDLK